MPLNGIASQLVRRPVFDHDVRRYRS